MKKTVMFSLGVLFFYTVSLCSSKTKMLIFKSATDTVFITTHLIFPDNTTEDIRSENYFLELLKNGFHRKEEKAGIHFEFLDSIDNESLPVYVVNFIFSNLKIGDEKREQNTRLATREKSKTIFDQAEQQHKVQSQTYQADITYIKKTINCSVDITVEISGPEKPGFIFDKKITGSYTWVNEYITYSGSVEPLTTAELKLARNRDQNPPLKPTLIKYLLQAAYNEVSEKISPVFRERKAF